jgi:hypothetical protein
MNGIRPVWMPHLRRASRPPQVEGFCFWLCFFCVDFVVGERPALFLARKASSHGVRRFFKLEVRRVRRHLLHVGFEMM